MQWLRRSFIAGFFVTVPLVVSVVTLVWTFRFVDGLTGPTFAEWLGREVPGLGLVTTAAILLAVGAIASNVIGRRLVQRAEYWLLKVPVFRTVYAPVKQLIVAFSPDNEFGFKRVVLVEDTARGFVLGFLTREFTLDRGSGPESLVAVYVPTNHLYLGDVRVFPASVVSYPAISVEEGIRIFLTGGMALRGRVDVAALPEARSRGGAS
ncbi:MAG: DUF502 domain-containing protein [Acidobacteria bacterium]|nr:DUF502 domain-containing protein [Acidobacteriota bacterium]